MAHFDSSPLGRLEMGWSRLRSAYVGWLDGLLLPWAIVLLAGPLALIELWRAWNVGGPSWSPNFVALVLFLVLGCGLIAHRCHWHRISLLVGGLILLAVTLTVSGRAPVDNSDPRLTPIAAFVVAALSLSLVLLQRAHLFKRGSAALAAGAIGLCILSLCGHALGLQPVTEWGVVANRFSVPANLCGLMAGILLVRKSELRLTHPLPLLSASLIMLLALGLIGARVSARQESSLALMTHTLDLLAASTRLRLELTGLERELNAYLLTGQPEHRLGARAYLQAGTRSVERLMAHAADSDDADRVGQLNVALRTRLPSIETLLDEDAGPWARGDREQLLQQARDSGPKLEGLVHDYMEFVEQRSEMQVSQSVEAMRRSSRLTPVGGSLAFLVLGFAAVYARKASMAAIEASRLKSEFLASMSHEIRTPLNGVVGMLQMLDTPSLAAEQQEQVRVALRSSDALMRLLNDILDLSKIESGKMELESLAFSPREAAAEVHALLRARAAEKNLQFDLAVSPDLPAAVRGDAARLKQVLLNLCGNAIKFTCIGRVTLTVTSRLGLTGPATLVFAVEDTGTGIAPEAQRKLFRAFEQGSLGIARNFGGSGLGLAISQRLIKQMNGEIRLVSTLGQGSCFSFDLTLPLADSLLPVPMERVAPAALESSFRILVAEDDGVSRLVIKALLGKAGLACTTVPDGLAAVEAVRQGTWDLVLMDVQMPGLDGLEATRQMRASGAIVPIVALTANVMPQDRVQCDQAGMDGFLGKPVREEELRACLRRWLPPLQAPASSPPVRHAGSASRPRERSRT